MVSWLPSLFCEGYLNSGVWDLGSEDERLEWHHFPTKTNMVGLQREAEKLPVEARPAYTKSYPSLPCNWLLTGARLTLSQGSWPLLQTSIVTIPQATTDNSFLFLFSSLIPFFFWNQSHSSLFFVCFFVSFFLGIRIFYSFVFSYFSSAFYPYFLPSFSLESALIFFDFLFVFFWFLFLLFGDQAPPFFFQGYFNNKSKHTQL